jgi:hypothetical protein
MRSYIFRFTDNCAEIGRDLWAWFRPSWSVSWLLA